jgi:hypothetical protein
LEGGGGGRGTALTLKPPVATLCHLYVHLLVQYTVILHTKDGDLVK